MRGMGNMQAMMQKVQKMQQEMVKEQNLLEAEVFEAEDAQKLVKIQMNGKKEVVDITIQPELLDPEDSEMLEDILVATLNQVLDKITKETETRIGKYTQGLNLPF